MFARRALLALALLYLAGCQTNPLHSRDIPDVVSVEDGSPQRTELNARVYDAAVAAVTRDFYDRNFNGVDFRAEAAARREAAIARPDERSFYRALNETLDLLDDVHTSAISPSTFRNMQTVRLSVGESWGFSVLDAVDSQGDSRYFIDRVRPDSPAAEAGVQPGWWIESLNGAAWRDSQTLGPDAPDVFRFVDRHETVHVKTIQTRPMPPEIGTAERRPDGVLVLSFFRFDDDSAAWVRARLAEARADPPRGVIIDLQGNGGGAIMSAARIIGGFFPESVPFARYSMGPVQRDVQYTRTFRDAWTGPLAIVQGVGSASAAEVFAATVQERRRGVVVGGQSAGAVVRATGRRLPDGGVLQIGVTELRTGAGVVLEKVGVTPDIAILPTYDDLVSGRNPAIEAAARALLEAAPAR